MTSYPAALVLKLTARIVFAAGMVAAAGSAFAQSRPFGHFGIPMLEMPVEFAAGACHETIERYIH